MELHVAYISPARLLDTWSYIDWDFLHFQKSHKRGGGGGERDDVAIIYNAFKILQRNVILAVAMVNGLERKRLMPVGCISHYSFLADWAL